MSEFFFISYSAVDAKDFAIKLADELASGPPSIPVWLDKRALRPGEDWDEQVVEAIKNCKGMIFVMSPDSVRPDSVCKNEWVRALKYKKPVIPLLLDRDAELPFRLGSREYINFVGSFDAATARLRKHLAWLDSTEGHSRPSSIGSPMPSVSCHAPNRINRRAFARTSRSWSGRSAAAEGHRQPQGRRSADKETASRRCWKVNASLPNRLAGLRMASSSIRLR